MKYPESKRFRWVIGLLVLLGLLSLTGLLGCIDEEQVYHGASSTTVKETMATDVVAKVEAESAIQTIKAKVIRVVDGDTIEVEMGGKTEKVRLTGVDTPETKHPSKPVEAYGKAASDFTQSKLDGKTVYLEMDVQERDKYGRVLAYVWLSQPSEIDDGEIRAKMFNAHLLLGGYAQIATYPPNVKYVDYFAECQKEARDADKGLWGVPATTTTTIAPSPTTTKPPVTTTTQKSVAPPAGGGGGTTVYITNTGEKYHSDGCQYLSKSKIPISLSDAKARGYTPCSRCGPPT